SAVDTRGRPGVLGVPDSPSGYGHCVSPRSAAETVAASTTADCTVVPDVVTLLHGAVTALGGAERTGQVDRAKAVGHTIRTGEHLAVQAGTGTGKSLGYLVPAIRHAVLE